ncbi:hypothetical protein PQX77_014562 [Marasmius sp. AFHP31]|nr:hypothetical protein PQX77_014562 [Marasmius sp. AFHP31]
MSTSSSLRTPELDLEDPFAYLTAAMNTPSSPIQPSPGPSRKRKQTDGDNSDSDQDEDKVIQADGPTRTQVPSADIGYTRNIMEKAVRYATKKKLCPEQLPEIEKFVRESEAVQRAKLYVKAIAIQNMVKNIVTAQLPYTVSVMETNYIFTYSHITGI